MMYAEDSAEDINEPIAYGMAISEDSLPPPPPDDYQSATGDYQPTAPDDYQPAQETDYLATTLANYRSNQPTTPVVVKAELADLQCNICGKYLSSIASLADHQRTHTGDRPFACTVCDKRFTQNAHLNIHKRTHTGEKPYSCPICQKRFAQTSHLKNHKRVHTGEKPYFCSVCDMGFCRKTRLQQHLEKHFESGEVTSGLTSGDGRPLTSGLMGNDGMPLFGVAETPENKDWEVVYEEPKPSVSATKKRIRKRKPSTVNSVGQGATEDDGSGKLIKLEPADDDYGGENVNGELDSDSRNGEIDASHPAQAEVEDNHIVRQIANDFGLTELNAMLNAAQGNMQDADDAVVTSTDPANNDGTGNASSTPKAKATSPISTYQNVSRRISLRKRPVPSTPLATRLPTTPGIRTNNRICLVDFSTDDLITHLMSRDTVFRCEYCRIIFEDAAMYHLHRCLHDKMEIRSCNLCGRMAKDKHDFSAHFLVEHK